MLDSEKHVDPESNLKNIRGQTPYETAVQKEVISAFEVFDDSKKGIVTFRDVCIVIRYFDFFPTEAEVKSLLSKVEANDDAYKVSDVLPIIVQLFKDDKYKPVSEEKLIEAFEYLKKKSDGPLNSITLSGYLRGFGEPLSVEETNNFLSAIQADKKTADQISYKDYVRTNMANVLNKP